MWKVMFVMFVVFPYNEIVSYKWLVTALDTQTPQKWPLGFWDCCSYKEDGTNMCCPYFFPMGLLGTCFLVGKIRTLYVKEEKTCCCDMGSQGCCLCIVSTPINICGPLGGFCWFALNSMKMRHDVAKKYNLVEENTSCPSCCVGSSQFLFSIFDTHYFFHAIYQTSLLVFVVFYVVHFAIFDYICNMVGVVLQDFVSHAVCFRYWWRSESSSKVINSNGKCRRTKLIRESLLNHDVNGSELREWLVWAKTLIYIINVDCGDFLANTNQVI